MSSSRRRHALHQQQQEHRRAHGGDDNKAKRQLFHDPLAAHARAVGRHGARAHDQRHKYVPAAVTAGPITNLLNVDAAVDHTNAPRRRRSHRDGFVEGGAVLPSPRRKTAKPALSALDQARVVWRQRLLEPPADEPQPADTAAQYDEAEPHLVPLTGGASTDKRAGAAAGRPSDWDDTEQSPAKKTTALTVGTREKRKEVEPPLKEIANALAEYLPNLMAPPDVGKTVHLKIPGRMLTTGNRERTYLARTFKSIKEQLLLTNPQMEQLLADDERAGEELRLARSFEQSRPSDDRPMILLSQLQHTQRPAGECRSERAAPTTSRTQRRRVPHDAPPPAPQQPQHSAAAAGGAKSSDERVAADRFDDDDDDIFDTIKKWTEGDWQLQRRNLAERNVALNRTEANPTQQHMADSFDAMFGVIADIERDTEHAAPPASSGRDRERNTRRQQDPELRLDFDKYFYGAAFTGGRH